MQVTVIEAIRRGFGRAIFHPGLLALRWLLSLVAAWWLADPIIKLFESQMARSVMPETMTVGIPYTVFMEAASELLPGASLYGRLVVVGIVCYWLLNQFLNGGIFAAVAQESHFGPGRFLLACRQYFSAMLATTLVGFILFIIFVAGTTTLWAHLVMTTMYDIRSPGMAFYSWWLGAFAILVLMGSAVWRIVDVMRLLLCSHQGDGGRLLLAVPGACLRASAFFVRYHFGTFALFAAFIAAQMVVVILSRYLFSSQGILLWWMIQATVIVRLALGLGRICAMHSFMAGRINQGATPTSPKDDAEPESSTVGERHDPFASVYEQSSAENIGTSEFEDEAVETTVKAEVLSSSESDSQRVEQPSSALPWADFQEEDSTQNSQADVKSDPTWKSDTDQDNRIDKNTV